MKKCLFTCFCLFLFAGYVAKAQIGYVSLQDNWQIPSDTSIKVIPGQYTFDDADSNGIIQIVGQNNVTIDGDSVMVDGVIFKGFMIYIQNSSNITIKNFNLVNGYFYGCFVKQSTNVRITNCNFSQNMLDTTGSVNLSYDVDSAYGGGLFMEQTTNSRVDSNTMQLQNDGVALYLCDSIIIDGNLLSYNNAFGVKLFHSDSCYVFDNVCSNTKWFTDLGDYAAIGLRNSSNNRIEQNNCTYSGKGIMINFYNFMAPSRNYVKNNDCSYSIHSGIESAFTEGNTFVGNVTTFCRFGYWLSYSTNILVDSGQIHSNARAGIAHERGYDNIYSNNDFSNNRMGIQLYAPELTFPYTNESRDYQIRNNTFKCNTYGANICNTPHVVMDGNQFESNLYAIEIDSAASTDTITNNTFYRNMHYDINNISPDDIYAANNTFTMEDTAFIECKIYDKSDNSQSGTVTWQPHTPTIAPVFEEVPPLDLTEPSAVWKAYPQDGLPTDVAWDSVDKQVGLASLHVNTGSAADVDAFYWASDDQHAAWDLSGKNYMFFWLKTFDFDLLGFENNWIVLGNNCGGYYKYEAPATIFTNADKTWRSNLLPLAGDSTWQIDSVGEVSLSEINYVQIHANVIGFRYEMWLDGFEFLPTPGPNALNDPRLPESQRVSLYQNAPNPFSNSTLIRYHIPASSYVALIVFDITGSQVAVLEASEKVAGDHILQFDGGQLPGGVYFYSLQTSKATLTRKLVLMD